MATLPAGDIGRLMDVLGPVFPCLEPVAGVLETGFEGAGAMLHPIPSLMNVNKMDLGESYDYYMEGITPHIAEIITACDPKRVAVCRALGVEAMPLGDMLVKTYKLEPKIASTALCLLGAYIAMQPSFDSNPLPLLAALSAAVVAGIAYTMLPYCKNFTAPSVIIFHFSLLSTVCSAVLLLPSFVVPPLPVCFMLLMVGVFAAGGAVPADLCLPPRASVGSQHLSVCGSGLYGRAELFRLWGSAQRQFDSRGSCDPGRYFLGV